MARRQHVNLELVLLSGLGFAASEAALMPIKLPIKPIWFVARQSKSGIGIGIGPLGWDVAAAWPEGQRKSGRSGSD